MAAPAIIPSPFSLSGIAGRNLEQASRLKSIILTQLYCEKLEHSVKAHPFLLQCNIFACLGAQILRILNSGRCAAGPNEGRQTRHIRNAVQPHD